MTKVPIRILDTTLSLVSEVSNYEQAYFKRSLTGAGDFQIIINYNANHASDFKKDYFVLFGTNVHRIGVIENIAKAVGEDGKGSQILTITGREAKVIFDRRIIIPAAGASYYIQEAAQETVIKSTVTDQCGASASTKRKFNYLTVATDSARGSTYHLEAFNTSLLTDLAKCAESTSPYMGFECYLNTTTKKLVLDVIIGLDRRGSQSTNPRVYFSSSFGSLREATITDQNSGYRNAIYVGGQGDGANKTIRVVTSTPEPSDFLRREEYIDKSQLQSAAELDNAGLSELNALSQAVLSIDAQALVKSPFVLDTDYFLGDLVNIKEYGTTFDAQITSIQEAWAFGSYEISLEFGKQAVSIGSAIAANAQGLAVSQTSKASLGWKDYQVNFNLTSADGAQTTDQILADILHITGTISTNRVLTLQPADATSLVGQKKYYVYIDAATLVASSGGPFTITIKIASGATVIVPVAASGTTIDSGALYFAIYVDSAGNVTSDSWQISGHNANGAYTQFSGGTAILSVSITDTPTSLTSSNAFGTTAGTMYYFLDTCTYPIPLVKVDGISQAGNGRSATYSSLGLTSVDLRVLDSQNTSIRTTSAIIMGRWR